MDILPRSSGWLALPASNLQDKHKVLERLLSTLKLSAEIKYIKAGNSPTLAETFGAFVRELYEVYEEILNEMKNDASATEGFHCPKLHQLFSVADEGVG